jgi:hypothetical protein
VRIPGGNPELEAYEQDLGLPAGFANRPRPATATEKVAEVLTLRTRHHRRRFLLGVLLAYVAVAEELLELAGVSSLSSVFTDYPPRAVDSTGNALNSLTLGEPPHVISLRTYYNYAEHVIRHELLRYGYPNAAPHATQSWTQHRREFELICAMTPAERASLAGSLWQEALSLEEMSGQANAVREIRPFEAILADFPNTQKGEPAGAVLQGLAFAYYRADSPSVTLRVYKVGSGSSRVGAAGDIDGWIGDTLALSVESKDMAITEDNLSQLDQFVKQLSRWPNCTAVALARSFSKNAQDWLADHNILSFDRERMASNVAFWDVPKQQLAVREFLYYLAVIEGHAKLLTRFRKFCRETGITLDQRSLTGNAASEGIALDASDI